MWHRSLLFCSIVITDEGDAVVCVIGGDKLVVMVVVGSWFVEINSEGEEVGVGWEFSIIKLVEWIPASTKTTIVS